MSTATAGRVLVVDDTEMNRDLLVRRLTRQGYDVSTANNGREALERLATAPFDVMLLDIMMPEIDGYQVLERMRGDDGLPEVRVIMISAVDEMDSVIRCLELGADDYLTKPFNAALLKARLESSLARKRLRDRELLHARSLERELEIGREIQLQFLPERLPEAVGWDLAATLRPARQVSGDFYDAFRLDGSDAIAVAVADVCDKGVGAALFMALYRTLLRSGLSGGAAGDGGRPSLRLVNDYIATNHGRSNMFATMFVAVIEPASGRVAYINGGHEPPLLRRRDGGLESLGPTGPAVGMFENVPFEVAHAVLGPGDVLAAFTDGVTEARGASGELYGDDRLQGVLAGATGSAEAIVETIERDLAEHVGDAAQSDDVTLMVVSRAP